MTTLSKETLVEVADLAPARGSLRSACLLLRGGTGSPRERRAAESLVLSAESLLRMTREIDRRMVELLAGAGTVEAVADRLVQGSVQGWVIPSGGIIPYGLDIALGRACPKLDTAAVLVAFHARLRTAAQETDRAHYAAVARRDQASALAASAPGQVVGWVPDQFED